MSRCKESHSCTPWPSMQTWKLSMTVEDVEDSYCILPSLAFRLDTARASLFGKQGLAKPRPLNYMADIK